MMETKNFGGEQIAVAKPCGPWRMKCYDGALIKQQYLLSKCIGDGLTAVVYEAVDTFTCQPVAVKVLNRHQVESLLLTDNVQREIKHVAMLKHPNIVQLLDAFEDEESFFIVFELVRGNDLYDVIVESPNSRLTEPRAQIYFIQLLTAIEFIHSQGLCHRDIKPENVLVDGFDHIKLSDFGFCTHVQSLRGTKFIGSVQYMAPEICDEQNGHGRGLYDVNSHAPWSFGYNGQLVDIWSAGVVLYVMVTGQYPFEDVTDPENNEVTWQKIQTGDFHIPSFISSECRDLLLKMLKVKAEDRISLMQIRYHPFVRKPTD